MGFARLAEQSIRKARGIPEGKKLDTLDRIAASTFGGALGCWNQPIEVVRVEVRRARFPPWTWPLPRSHRCDGGLPPSAQQLTPRAAVHPPRLPPAQMQSMAKAAPTDAARPAKPTIANTLAYIYRENGIKGLYRGVTPRIGLGIWQTVRRGFPPRRGSSWTRARC